jgi:hypothetical protein
MAFLRQNTMVNLPIGPFLSTAGVLQTALTIAPTSVRLSKNGATFAAMASTTTPPHMELGFYKVTLVTGDVDTAGTLVVNVDASASAMPAYTYNIVFEYKAYDSIVAGTDNLQVDAVQVSGTNLTARDIGASVLLSSGTGTGQLDFTSGVVKGNVTQISGAAVSTSTAQLGVNAVQVGGGTVASGAVPNAVAGAAGGLFIAGTNAATTVTTALTTTFTGNLSGNVTGSVGSVTGAVGSVTGAVGSVTGAVGSVTGNVGGSVASVTGAVGSVTGNVGGSVASVTGAVGSVTGNVGGNVVGSVGSVTTVSDKTGYSLSTAGILAIWHQLTSAIVTASTIGKLIVDYLDAQVSSRLATAGYTTPPTVGAIADQVWDEATSGHTGAGTTGKALTDAGSAGDPWSTSLPGAYGAGTAGKIVGDNINAPIATVDTVVDAIKAKTDNLPASPAATGAQMDLVNAPNATAVTAIQNGLATAAALATVDAIADKLDTAMALDGAVYQFTTNALELAPTGGSAPSAATIADAVWDEATSGHTGAGSTGLALTSASAPTAATVADAVWDEAIAGHLTAGTAGNKLNAASAAAGAGSTSETITVTVGGSAQDGVNVWVTSDSAGTTVVASGFTNSSGQVTFLLDAGTYYAWCNRGGTNFTNPTTITVT